VSVSVSVESCNLRNRDLHAATRFVLGATATAAASAAAATVAAAAVAACRGETRRETGAPFVVARGLSGPRLDII
jgi:hypothetical protein